jgi:hypothetical protein
MTKRRSTSQLARDRKRIAELYLKGWIQADIADDIGVDQSTVSRDLSVLIDEWREEAVKDITETKAQELAKINVLENTYWQAWKDSQEDAVTKSTEKYMSGTEESTAQKRIKSLDKTVEQVGDPSFLRGVQWCIEKRCAILGLDAPKRVDQQTDGKMEIVVTYAESGRDDSEAS